MFGNGETGEMGYDMGLTTFSPAGRLYQVEYATEAIKQGTTAIGLRTNEGVVLLAEKRMSKLQVSETVQKIFIIDLHVGAAIAGLTADAMVLIDHARVQSQIYRLTYDEPIDIKMLVKRICDLKQVYTHNAGVRPFGVAFLITGIDKNGPKLFMTAPSGAFIGYNACAIGSGADTVMERLQNENSEYRIDMSLENAIILGLKLLKEVISEGLDERNVAIATITTKDPTFKIFTTTQIVEFISKI
ncbi:MAG: archaeal proteasome endopeptidase complex subunit alpha [Candidatus Helarchaeales archaeon]